LMRHRLLNFNINDLGVSLKMHFFREQKKYKQPFINNLAI
jgi:hypothetical protein